MKKIFFLAICFVLFSNIYSRSIVYVIKIGEDINSKMWIHTQKGLQEAEDLNAKLIVVHLNTYGGELNYADSISTKLLNSKIPTVAFIDNNAASAGALISISCNRIYMRQGARIGAATVVDGTNGEAMPDKYQSYMRGIMRATAESHGKDSTGKWVRDPLIAEAMVDPRTVATAMDDSTKTLTLTTLEAIEYDYCEAEVQSLDDVVALEKITDHKIVVFNPTFWDNLKGVLTGTIFRGLLVTLIIAGIWFELQSPGIGFALGLAVVAAFLYFAPLYIDGLAANWEILMFFVGIGLLLLEIFVIPGFGIAGIGGILAIFVSLIFGLLNNDMFDFGRVETGKISYAVLTVTIGLIVAFVAVIFISSKIGSKGILSKLSLNASQNVEDGYVNVSKTYEALIGRNGVAATDLRPSGKVEIDGKIYDAVANYGKFIEKNTNIKIVSISTGQIVAKAIDA